MRGAGSVGRPASAAGSDSAVGAKDSQCLDSAATNNGHEERSADERRDDTDLHFAFEGENATEHIRDQHHNWADQDRERQGDPLIPATKSARDVWHDESDERDWPERRRRGSGQDGDAREHKASDLIYGNAEPGGGVGAECERVQRRCEHRRTDQAERDEPNDGKQYGPAATFRGAGRPEPELVVRVLVREDHGLHDRGDGHVDRDAGKGEPRGAPAPAGPNSAKDIHNDADDRGTNEREPHVEPHAHDAGDRNREHHHERGPRVETEDPGVSDRVSGKRLDEHPRYAERGTNQDQQECAWHALTGNHFRFERAVWMPQQLPGDLRSDRRVRADAQAEC